MIKIRFLEITASLTIGFIIMYFGVLLNEFLLPDTAIPTMLFVIIGIIVANKIGKSLWNGLATLILFFIISFYFTKYFGEPEELVMLTDLIIYQGIIAIITTIIHEKLVVKRIKSPNIN